MSQRIITDFFERAKMKSISQIVAEAAFLDTFALTFALSDAQTLWA